MALAAGQKLAQYQLEEKIGAGGMGVVWRALDTTLKRGVAIKVLPEEISADPERLSRFQREARLLASLSHPNVASVFGFHDIEGVRFLAMELLEGETLEKKLARGAMPIEEALGIARQIAEGLSGAHERGIIHRDLKPANIHVAANGSVKILDFGLARVSGTQAACEGGNRSDVATVTDVATRTGVVLGTVLYMSPEQARGQAVDRRADIWAFGCVLFECLTGRRTFPGDSEADILGAILRAEPRWDLLPADVPRLVGEMLRRCLRKEARSRLHDIADARIILEEALSGHAAGGDLADAPKRPARAVLAWAVPALIALAALGAGATGRYFLSRDRSEDARPARFDLFLGPDLKLHLTDARSVTISPDGSRVVFAAAANGTVRLYRRDLGGFETTPIPGTEGALDQFFSPDGEEIAFYAGGALRRVSLEGGPSLKICEAASNFGGAWGEDGDILFTPRFLEGLHRVPAGGGAPASLIRPDHHRGENMYQRPVILPGGRAVVFAVWSGGGSEKSRIAAHSFRSGETSILVEGATAPAFVPPGHLLFLREKTILAAPFDPEGLKVTGPPVPILGDVMVNPDEGIIQADVSRSGALVYAPGGVWGGRKQVMRVGAAGPPARATQAWRDYWYPRLSPDGRRLAVTISEGVATEVYLLDLETSRMIKISSGGNNALPIWRPDGRALAYASDREGDWDVYVQMIDREGAAERLLEKPGEGKRFPSSWSSDGRYLAFTEEAPGTGQDLWAFDTRQRKAQPILRTPANESWLSFSPDGRLFAYQSDETGQWEVYARSFLQPGAKERLSTGGGYMPLWRSAGEEIVFQNGERVYSVRVDASPALRPGEPVPIFDGPMVESHRVRNYDADPRGRDLFLVQSEAVEPLTSLRVVLDFAESLREEGHR